MSVVQGRLVVVQIQLIEGGVSSKEVSIIRSRKPREGVDEGTRALSMKKRY